MKRIQMLSPRIETDRLILRRYKESDIDAIYEIITDERLAKYIKYPNLTKDEELECIKKYFANYPERNAEQVLEGLHKERQRLIHPIRETDEQYIQNWRNVAYEGKGFAEDAPEFYTSRGERVRSKSEWIIAELLEKEGIPYRYEYPVYLRGFGKVYPDFTVLNVRTRKEIYWEHMGMMDNPIYAEKAINKIHTYEQNGMFQGEDLLVTYETSKSPLNQKVIMRMIPLGNC